MPDRQDARRPEWAETDTTGNGGEDAFASRVLRGVIGGHDGFEGENLKTPDRTQAAPVRKGFKGLTVEEHVEGVLRGDRAVLARTITLIESNAPAHFDMAQEVLKRLLPHTGGALRVGVTGVPGAGKSTLIEALGLHLTAQGKQVAVLAVDPSSSITGGSILGDKTRMEHLSREPNAFIRPSPTGGMLGGVARKSRETLLLCEAAGFEVVIIETVGTGQSEIAVRSMVDFFLLVLITGAGDELQGIKKGVMEIADAIVINKADGDNKIRAQAARVDTNRALHYLTPATEGWHTQAYTASALNGDGIAEIWDVIETFRDVTMQSGLFKARRQAQTREWLHTLVEAQLKAFFFGHPAVKAALPDIEQAVTEGKLPPTSAARELLRSVLNKEEG